MRHINSRFTYLLTYLRAGTTHEWTVAHAVLHRGHLPWLVLSGQPHPSDRRHVLRRLSETRERTG